MPEMTYCCELFLPYCKGNGIDIGFGGYPVIRHAICMDRPEGHSHRAPMVPAMGPTHLAGDARDLYWFRDGVLDFAASAHVLEDFGETETVPVLREWLRIIKPGGHLCLFLPDQPRYVAYCREQHTEPNGAHKIAHFGLAYVKKCLEGLPAKVVFESDPFPGNVISFAIVLQKL